MTLSHSIMYQSRVLYILLILCVLLFGQAFAAPESDKKDTKVGQTQSESKTTDSGVDFKKPNPEALDSSLKESQTSGDVLWMIVRVFFALAFVGILIFFLVRFLSRKSGNFNSTRKLRIVAGIGLSPQKSMQIVEVGNKLYIVGVGNDIQVLDKIEAPEEIEALIESLDAPLIENQFLLTWKDKISTWFKKKEVVSEEMELDIEEYEKLFSEQLKDATNRQNTVEQWMDENKERSEEK
jgi:flagellar protein FliO/FliZ